MAFDYSSFNPGSAQEFFDSIVGEVSAQGAKWWQTNSEYISGHLRALSQSIMHTQAALAVGQISPQAARAIANMQRTYFDQIGEHTKYMTFILAQKIADVIAKMIGWAVFNRTGFNLFPEVVHA